jgi:acetyltransferase-like isoleucine patch superfamily enzyme
MIKIRNLVRLFVINIRYRIFTKVYGMDIHKSSRISFKAKLDKTNPKGIHIGEDSYIAAGVYILSHDFTRRMHRDTYIGKSTFIGINTIVMPGVVIGDHVIVGSGAVVTKNIPSNCIAAGNPARVIKENIVTKKFGQLV